MNEGQTNGVSIRVLVVDDHDLFRTGLASLLGTQPDIEIVAQASGGRMGIRLAGELHPDVVLMDLRMPDIEGSEATFTITQRDPSMRVLALTAVSDDTAVSAAMRAGASGFLAKDTPISEVVAAVRAAAGGSSWLSPRAAEVVLGGMRETGGPGAVSADSGPDDDALKLLSRRERDVLRLIARAMDNGQIAEELGISPRTAKNHVSNILAKLGLSSRIQAAIYAVRSGLE